jgi:formylglycine-generating enzyme
MTGKGLGDAMRRWGLWLVAAWVFLVGPLAAQQTNRDCPTCPEMVVIPPGSFTMGVPPGEEEREAVPEQFRGRSLPQHRVTIQYSFSLSRHEVTRVQFSAFVQATGHMTGTSCRTLGDDKRFTDTPGRDWRNPGFLQTPNDPVVCVSWNDALAYVTWLKRTTGKEYRLPSEAEWEYAARAGSTTARYWGDGRDNACLYGNVSDLTLARRNNLEKQPQFFFPCPDEHLYTAPVGQFRPNAFGLFDMLGNAMEWVGDCWKVNYNGAPTNGSYWAASGDCSSRVVRGGSWNDGPRVLRAGFRIDFAAGYRSHNLGFRVVRNN